MKRLVLALLLAAFSSVLMAQANRTAELDKAVEEARAALLEQEVELARRRYEAALKRWNDLK